MSENDMQKYKKLRQSGKSQIGELRLLMLLTGLNFYPGAFISRSYQ